MAYKWKSTLLMITMSYSFTRGSESIVQMTHPPYDGADLNNPRVVAGGLYGCTQHGGGSGQ
jgi:hypothetical protein